MITGVSHVSYTVKSLERSIAFYGSTLGIEHVRTQVSDQPYLARVIGLPGCSLLIGFAGVEGDTAVIEFIQYVYPTSDQAGVGFGRVGTPYHCWVVDDLSAACQRLSSQGVVFMAEPRPVGRGPWGDASGTILVDPDGLLVELIELTGATGGQGRLTRMHHTNLVVSDAAAAVDWLSDNLGLAVLARWEGENDYARHLGRLSDAYIRTAYLSIPHADYLLQLWEFRSPTGPPADTSTNNIGSGHFCFMVDDILTDYESLTALGVQFVGPPAMVTHGANRGAYAIYFVGPDGMRLELFQGSPTRVA